jgi:hypothetical protein
VRDPGAGGEVNTSFVKEQAPQWVVPNPQVPRAFGLMNIIFGSLMLLVGAGSAVWFFLAPTVSKWIQVEVKKGQDSRKSEHDAKLAELKRREAAAKTEEEKQAVQDERTILEEDAEPDISGMDDLFGVKILSDRRIVAYTVSELAAGILLNVFMIISGVGLMALAEWGRRMAIWVDWLKIARWVAMTVVTMVLILPITLETTRKAIQLQFQAQAKMKAGGKAAPMLIASGQMSRVMAIASAVAIVFQAAVASVYPALSLWFLTRAPARAACFKETPLAERLEANGPGGSW